MTLGLRTRIVASRFPKIIDRFLNPSPTDNLENAVEGLDHHLQHGQINDSLNALEKKVGIDGSTDQTSLDYLLKTAVDPGHTHTPTGGGSSIRQVFTPDAIGCAGTFAVPAKETSYSMRAIKYVNDIDSATDNYTTLNFSLDDWDGTSAVNVHIWHSTNSAGNVMLGLHHRGLNNEAPNLAMTSQTTIIAAATNVTKTTIALSGGLTAGDFVCLNMPRYGSNALDTCSGVFWIWLVIIEYN